MPRTLTLTTFFVGAILAGSAVRSCGTIWPDAARALSGGKMTRYGVVPDGVTAVKVKGVVVKTRP